MTMLDKEGLAAALDAATELVCDGGAPVNDYVNAIVSAYLSHAAGDVAGLVESAMEQAQEFASSYSLVGGRFDDGSQMQQAEEAKQELRDMLASALLAIQAENAGLKAELAAARSGNRYAQLEAQALRRAEAAETRVKELTRIVSAFISANDEGPGLIDCIDNDGDRYTSQYLCDTVAAARSTLAKEVGR